MSSTTVRVRRRTHDELVRLAAERNESADNVIVAALRALDLQERRRQAQLEARQLAADPDDRAETHAAQRDLDSARAW